MAGTKYPYPNEEEKYDMEMRKAALDELSRQVAARENLVSTPVKSREVFRLPEMVNIATEEANLLLKELHELHERLSPLLSDTKVNEVISRTAPPAACELSGNVANICQVIIASRQAITTIMTQLDL